LIAMAFHEKFSQFDKLPAELESLFSTYRASVPEVEPSIEFMPRLWERIDSQQRITYSFRRLARGFVTVAAALCLCLSAAVLNPPQTSTSHAGTYVDVLADTDDGPDSSVTAL